MTYRCSIAEHVSKDRDLVFLSSTSGCTDDVLYTCAPLLPNSRTPEVVRFQHLKQQSRAWPTGSSPTSSHPPLSLLPRTPRKLNGVVPGTGKSGLASYACSIFLHPIPFHSYPDGASTLDKPAHVTSLQHQPLGFGTKRCVGASLPPENMRVNIFATAWSIISLSHGKSLIRSTVWTATTTQSPANRIRIEPLFSSLPAMPIASSPLKAAAESF